MESVTVKFQEDVLKRIDESIERNNFNSRTEFIREAVRDKLSGLEREAIIKDIMKFRGSSNRKTSEEDLARIREDISKEYLERYEKQFR